MAARRVRNITQVVCLDVGPREVPIGTTVEFSADCCAVECQMVNTSNTAAEVSVYDLQPTPIALIPPTTLQPGGMVSMDSVWGRRMLGGFQWSASGAGIHGYALLKME